MRKCLNLLVLALISSAAPVAHAQMPASMQKREIARPAAPLKQGAITAPIAAPVIVHQSEPVTDQKLQLAHQFNTNLTGQMGYEKTMSSIADRYITQLKQKHPDVTEQQTSAIHQNMIEITKKYKPKIDNENDRYIAREFTADELRHINNFSNTPVGQKLGKKGGEVARNLISGQSIGVDSEISEAVGSFDLEEIQQIKAFYTSPVGMKVARNMDRYSQEMQANNNKYLQQISNEVDQMSYGILGYHFEME